MTRIVAPIEALDHGDHRRYHRGCRCTACTTAASTEAAKWKYLRATGRGSIVSTTRTIAHIWALRTAGMPDQEIADTAGVGFARLHQILVAKRIRYYTAAKILAVPIPEAASTRNGAFVSNLGTLRRLRAMTADGWPAPYIEDRIGTGDGYVAYLLRRPAGGTVRLFTASAVRRLCDELAGKSPEEHGVLPRAAAAARDKAADKDWPGTDYWDQEDYDDPDFIPATTDDVSKRIDVTHLLSCGISNDEVMARTGASIAYVRDIAAELRNGKRRDRSRKTTAA